VTSLRLPAPARPVLLGGMDPERDDYADPDVPSPEAWAVGRVFRLAIPLLTVLWALCTVVIALAAIASLLG
jgi:hypothetical protein